MAAKAHRALWKPASLVNEASWLEMTSLGSKKRSPAAQLRLLARQGAPQVYDMSTLGCGADFRVMSDKRGVTERGHRPVPGFSWPPRCERSG